MRASQLSFNEPSTYNTRSGRGAGGIPGGIPASWSGPTREFPKIAKISGKPVRRKFPV